MDYKGILRILGGPDVAGAVRAVAGGRVVDEFGAAVVSARACALGLALRLRLRLELATALFPRYLIVLQHFFTQCCTWF